MALGEIVAGNVGVEMMNVMVFNTVSEEAKESQGNIGAALECRTGEAPFFGPSPISYIDRVLEMSDDRSQHLSAIFAQPEIDCWNSESWQHPDEEHHRQYFFEKCHAENTVSFCHHYEQTQKPSKGDDNKAVNKRLSDNSCDYFLHSFHFIVLLFGEEDGLCDIFNVQVPRMLMVVVVAVPPSIEREVIVDAENLAKDGVHFHGFEEGEVSHIVELKEVPHVQEGLKGPSNHSKTSLDQHNDDQLHSKRCNQRQPRFFVIGLGVFLDVLLDEDVLWGLDGLIAF